MRTGVRFPPAPPLLKPQLFSVGAFFRLMATVPACLRGFVRKPADFASRPSGSFPATFRSLQAILLSGLALRRRPEVRRGSVRHPFKSTGYARTVQAVGLRHCLPGGDKVVGGSNQIPPTPLRAYLSLARWSSQSAGGSTARSNSVTWLGMASSRMAATMSGANVVRLTIRLT